MYCLPTPNSDLVWLRCLRPHVTGVAQTETRATGAAMREIFLLPDCPQKRSMQKKEKGKKVYLEIEKM